MNNPYHRRLGAQAPPNLYAAEEFVPYTLPHPEKYPYEMDLVHVVSHDQVDTAQAQGRYSCYIVGDVGGVIVPAPQRAVAAAMCALTPDGLRYDVAAQPCGGTLFSYIVGDVVYYNGERSHYRQQFYEPYEQYGRPIMAIPGNHDGSIDDDTMNEAHPRVSLEGFVANFCAGERGPATDAAGSRRGVMDQPNVYWTLEAPWLRIVGLYTNVPEGGVVEAAQRRWFREQMARPRDGKHVIIALHQPVFSADSVHGGSEDMMLLVHDAAKRAGCRLVISGHVHNYQRFAYDGVTYLVNGAGGFFELHDVLPPQFPGAVYPLVTRTLEHSLVHMTVTPDRLILRAIVVPVPFVAGDWNGCVGR